MPSRGRSCFATRRTPDARATEFRRNSKFSALSLRVSVAARVRESAGGFRARARSRPRNSRASRCHAQNGATPLWKAACYGHLDCVRLLVEAGANKNIVDNNGRKPIDIVCEATSNKANKGAIEALLR